MKKAFARNHVAAATCVLSASMERRVESQTAFEPDRLASRYGMQRLAISIAMALGGALPVAAYAQSSETDAAKQNAATMETVTVTGSHIKSAQISGVGPITVIDAQTIQNSGATSVDVLLQRLPASAGGAGNQTNSYWTSNGYGTTQVNLRGLGIDRTLVLLNGRRVVNGGTGANSSVDLNMIPVALIERIEVLKDGASAIYGADAVAGVVNIITKKSLDGGQASVRYGETSKGDGADYAADLVWGTRSERGSLIAALDYAESRAVNMARRAPCGLGEVNGKLACVGSSSTIGGRARLADGTMVNFNQDPNGDPRAYFPYSSKFNYNSNPSLNAVSPIKRVSFSSFGHLNINDGVSLFTELMFTNRRSNQLATPGTLGIYRPIVIPASNPINPTGQNLTLLRRRLAETGPRQFYQETNTFRIVTGLEGKLGTGWDWNVALNWGRNTGVEGSTNVANLDRVDQTLNPSVCGNAPGAAIPCGNYLGYGNVSKQVLDYIMFKTRDTGGNDQRSLTGNLTGQLFDLPAGAVGFATGVEIRKEKGWRDPDQLTQIGAANTNIAQSIAGGYTAKEGYAELAVPLLAEKPLVDMLTLSLAGRYSNFDLFGTDSTYKLGLDWQLMPSLKLRATRSTAFRVPSVPELFGGVAEGNLTTTDPCSNWSTLPSTSVIYQNCKASGVPIGYKQLGNTILTTVGGNINLQPEDAKTLTVGAVWTPQFVPGLTMTLDYYDIKINNAIQSIAGSTKLALCYNTPGLKHPFCSAANFTRDPLGGEINFLSSQPMNTANENLRGVDWGALYEFEFNDFKGSLDWDVTYLNRYDVTPYQGAAKIEYAGKITGGRGSYTHWRSFGALNLARGAWSGSYSLQYIGRADDINAAPGDLGDHAPAVTYHNVQAKYAFAQSFDVAFGIDNLFDKKAPFIQSYTDANTDTMTYDLLGRRWYAKLNYRW
ncbi:MAG: TonB-dependent receptor [Rudaea sp.]|nr:TonB-dependent receptor [Rudaea sp.]